MTVPSDPGAAPAGMAPAAVVPAPLRTGLLPPPPAELEALAGRVVHAARSTFDVYVGRAHPRHPAQGWGNPCRMSGNTDRARAAALSGFWAALQSSERLRERAVQLRGATVACWCAPLPCHGLLLLACAEGLSGPAGQWAAQLAQASRTLPPRLLVTGSRTWSDPVRVKDALRARWLAWDRPAAPVLVVGDAAGADALARAAWSRAGMPSEVHRARWDELGKSAGSVRNGEMVQSTADWCLAFPREGSVGTWDCARRARSAGIPVTVVEG